MIRENSGELCLGPHAQMQKQKGPTAFCKDQGMAATKNPLATTWTDVGGFRSQGFSVYRVNMSATLQSPGWSPATDAQGVYHSRPL